MRLTAKLAAELLCRLPDALAEPIRVTAAGRLACLVLVWDTAGAMPTVAGEQRRRQVRGRGGAGRTS